MESGLKDKVVFITGASGGIGRELARAFAAEGARVALQGQRKFDELEALVAKQSWAERALCLRADVTKPAELTQAIARTREQWGRVDVCVANAGIWPPEFKLLHEISEVRLREVVDINLLGAVWTARAFMTALAEDGPRKDGDGASMVFTGSTAGQFGEAGHADYALSKAGLQGLVQTLKTEIAKLDPYARVNMVEPGWTATEMARPALRDPDAVTKVVRSMSLRQIATAKDIARTVLFLASPKLARHISGQTLSVSGGMEGRILWGEKEINFEEVTRRMQAK